MKKLYLILITLFLTFSSFSYPDCNNCPERFRFGLVKIVDRRGIADLVVYVDDRRGTADFIVRKNNDIPSLCGEWRFVDSGQDFTIYIDDRRGTADLVIYFEED